MNIARFLYPEPPDRDEDVHAVWVGRVLELQQALGIMDAVLDDPPGKPLAVVGGARVGKSHLLRKIECAIRDRFNAVVRIRLTSGYRDFRQLLIGLLDQTIEQLRASVERNGIAGPSPLLAVEDIRRRFSPLIEGGASDMELTAADSRSLGLKLTGSLTASGKLGGKELSIGSFLGVPVAEATGSASGGGEVSGAVSGADTEKHKYLRFEESQLLRLVMLAHRLCRGGGAGEWKTLLVLDDFDLLKREQDGSLDPQPLLRTMQSLAQEDGLFVLTTVREDTYGMHKKDLYRLVALRPFTEPELLERVYARHVEVWYGNEDPFIPAFTQAAAQNSSGRVGLFLQLMRDAFEHAGGKVEFSLASYLRGEWERLEELEPSRTQAFRVAVSERGGRLDSAAFPTIRPSVLSHWVFEDYSSHDAVLIHPAMRAFLSQQLLEDEAE